MGNFSPRNESLGDRVLQFERDMNECTIGEGRRQFEVRSNLNELKCSTPVTSPA